VFFMQKVKRWVADPVESITLQVPRAFVASVLALAIDFSIYVVGVRVLGMPATLAAVFGYLAGGVLQYVLCSVWVFSTTLKSDTIGFFAFTLLSLVGLGITWVVILVAHDWSGVAAEPAKCAAVGLAFAWNFLSRKYLLFRPESLLMTSPQASASEPAA
jgi:putative flippase GtrA